MKQHARTPLKACTWHLVSSYPDQNLPTSLYNHCVSMSVTVQYIKTDTECSLKHYLDQIASFEMISSLLGAAHHTDIEILCLEGFMYPSV